MSPEAFNVVHLLHVIYNIFTILIVQKDYKNFNSLMRKYFLKIKKPGFPGSLTISDSHDDELLFYGFLR